MIDEGLIFKILKFLCKTYPNKLMGTGQVLPTDNNQREIDVHLAYCAGKCLIELKESIMSDGSARFSGIRITSKGIDWLIERPK